MDFWNFGYFLFVRLGSSPGEPLAATTASGLLAWKVGGTLWLIARATCFAPDFFLGSHSSYPPTTVRKPSSSFFFLSSSLRRILSSQAGGTIHNTQKKKRKKKISVQTDWRGRTAMPELRSNSNSSESVRVFLEGVFSSSRLPFLRDRIGYLY